VGSGAVTQVDVLTIGYIADKKIARVDRETPDYVGHSVLSSRARTESVI